MGVGSLRTCQHAIFKDFVPQLQIRPKGRRMVDHPSEEEQLRILNHIKELNDPQLLDRVDKEPLKSGDLVSLRRFVYEQDANNSTRSKMKLQKAIIMTINEEKQLGLFKYYKIFNFVTKKEEYVWGGSLEVISIG